MDVGTGLWSEIADTEIQLKGEEGFRCLVKNYPQITEVKRKMTEIRINQEIVDWEPRDPTLGLIGIISKRRCMIHIAAGKVFNTFFISFNI